MPGEYLQSSVATRICRTASCSDAKKVLTLAYFRYWNHRPFHWLEFYGDFGHGRWQRSIGKASKKQNWCDFQSSLCSSRVFSISQVVQDFSLNGSAESAENRVHVRHSHKTMRFINGKLVLSSKVLGNTMHHVYMVMEYIEHELLGFQMCFTLLWSVVMVVPATLVPALPRLKVLISQQRFAVAEMKCLLRQLLCGVAHLHSQWIVHRDLKTSNILLDRSAWENSVGDSFHLKFVFF